MTTVVAARPQRRISSVHFCAHTYFCMCCDGEWRWWNCGQCNILSECGWFSAGARTKWQTPEVYVCTGQRLEVCGCERVCVSCGVYEGDGAPRAVIRWTRWPEGWNTSCMRTLMSAMRVWVACVRHLWFSVCMCVSHVVPVGRPKASGWLMWLCLFMLVCKPDTFIS